MDSFDNGPNIYQSLARMEALQARSMGGENFSRMIGQSTEPPAMPVAQWQSFTPSSVSAAAAPTATPTATPATTLPSLPIFSILAPIPPQGGPRNISIPGRATTIPGNTGRATTIPGNTGRAIWY